jgi:hypothetical protein
MTDTQTDQQTDRPAALRAFHGDPKIKRKYLARVRRHQKADAIIQHYGYWKGGRGCGVGCTIHSDQHSAYETELGIPEQLAHLEDALFEGMSTERSKTWPGEFLAAIKPGADLSKVTARFVIWAGIDPEYGIVNLAQSDAERAVVREVCAMYQHIIDGGTVAQNEWLDAENRALAVAGGWARGWAVAVAVAVAGAWALAVAGGWAVAVAGAWAVAVARYEQQADKLLELLREAE